METEQIDSDQESITSGLSSDDQDYSDSGNESDIQLDEEGDDAADEAEAEDAIENDNDGNIVWNWNQDRIRNTTTYLDEARGHTTITFNKTVNPIDVFNEFFTKDIIDMIVTQTNIYGKQKILGNNSTTKWEEISENTIRSFLGLLIIMGLHRLPRIRHYWSRNKIFYTEVVANVMSRNEFYRILSALHLSDNSKQDQFPKKSKEFKLFKIFDFMCLLKKNFQKHFKLGTNVSIDESMIKFKGKSSLKQYLPSKPIKRGYKVWCLADALTGYLYNFDIYTGKEEEKLGALGEQVVLKLINGLNLLQHHIFFDNFFTSVTLLLQLKKKEVAATGTIRTNRKVFPKELLGKDKLETGEYKFFSSHGISVVKWQDKKPVFVAINFYDPRETDTVTRKQKDGTKKSIICPKMISEYNKFMRGVDLFDQRISCYSIDRKSKRNWIRIFIYFLEASLSNAFICYKDLNVTNMNYAEFLSSISTSLIDNNQNSRKRRGRPISLSARKQSEVQQVLKQNKPSAVQLSAHMPVAGSKGRCRYCSTRSSPVVSSIKCNFCNVSLCVKRKKNCFLLFHERIVQVL